MASRQPGARPDAMTTPSQRHQLFISYSHADREWVDRLQTMMKPLVRNYDLKLWDDSQIPAGAKWKEEIEHALSTAKVALLLVSSNFLASDFVNHSELPHILKAAEEKGVQILWVPLRSSLVHLTPINDYQAVVNPKRPLQAMDVWEQDEAMQKIAEVINTTFKEAREKEEQERQQAENVAREEEVRQRKNAEHQQNLQRYEQEFSRAINAQYPLLNDVADGLKRFQQELELSNEDVAQIEEPLLAPKQEEYKRQQDEERECQQAEAERSAQAEAERAQAEAERHAREEKERQRQEEVRAARVKEESERKAEAELRARERQETERVAREKVSPVSSPPDTTAPEVLGHIHTTHGWLVREGDRWQVKTQVVEVEGYREQLAPGVAITLLSIPAGSFQMGSPQGEEGRNGQEDPQHNVKLREFFLAQTPITQAQWVVVAGWEKVERDLKPDPSNFKGPNRPVEQVSWFDAMEFCHRLSQRSGKRYGLPSEAQWEYACRAGTTTPFHFGPTLTPELANYNGNSTYGNGPKGTYREQTTDVASFPANAWGLHDLHGNVREWCEDLWHENYQGAPCDGRAWSEPQANAWMRKDWRRLRGGSWYYDPVDCRSAYRYCNHPDYLYSIVGFRVCCLPPGHS